MRALSLGSPRSPSPEDKIAWLTESIRTIESATHEAGVESRSVIGAAPNDAKYIVQTADSELSAAQVLGALATGLLKNTTSTGGLSIAVAGTDYQASILTSGQIDFPAVQVPSAGANVLDDYEEGTWTPAITFATPGSLSITYSVQTGTYTKIGRKVTVSFEIITSAVTLGTASGNMTITGLPVSVGSLANHAYTGTMDASGWTKANYTQIVCTAGTSANVLSVLLNGSGQARFGVTPAETTPAAGVVVFIGTITYFV